MGKTVSRAAPPVELQESGTRDLPNTTLPVEWDRYFLGIHTASIHHWPIEYPYFYLAAVVSLQLSPGTSVKSPLAVSKFAQNAIPWHGSALAPVPPGFTYSLCVFGHSGILYSVMVTL